ncbi:MAG: lytic transglycosylase domain-containing protein [Azoarcus sp.]|jgi:soluble lytic murein transglycosylase|nr:lytic transglycosylase domain-containing protein [Azoarcus sp.]
MNKALVQTFARVAAVIASVCCHAFACAQSGDAYSAGENRFLDARDAAKKGDQETLEYLASQMSGHPLDSYVRYWQLSTSLSKAFSMPRESDLSQFISDEAGTLLAERLRVDWLRRMARDGDWSYFLQMYPSLQSPDSEMRCQAWNARLATGDRKALDEIVKSWASLTLAHTTCLSAMREAHTQGRVGDDEVWQLFRRRVDTRSPGRARAVLGWVAPGSMKSFVQSVRRPKRTLDRLPRNFARTRAGREMALVALTRLARDDVSAAYVRFQRISGRLSAEERAHGWGVLALHAAQNHNPNAAIWFRHAGNVPMSVTQRAWRVRVPLRDGDWQGVIAAINKLPPEERALPEWIYWRGRALKSLNRSAEADSEFRRIANVANFYGILANEEFGNPFDPRAAHTALAAPPVTAVSEEAVAEEAAEGGELVSEESAGEGNGEDGGNGNGEAIQVDAGTEGGMGAAVPVNGPGVDNHPGFLRAMALFRLDFRMDAIREWNWALRGRDQAFRLAAAQLALKNHLYDRAITSAEIGNPAGAWELRFLTPYRDLIEPRARANYLDLAWVYGVMRQESRFIIPARSPTGAQGLMQVMPKTGKWVARQLGMHYHPGLLRDPETNVEIGTGYMRIILDELEGDQVLAAAGYNAGPGRARRWRAGRPLEGALYAETIPFEETREYVKHVMSNTVIYAALLEGKPQSLKARLGTIMPKMLD